MLEVDKLCARFGGVAALKDVSFTLGRGEFLALIGPNGAGKTTTLNAISRLFTPASGDIRLEGKSLLRRAPHEVIAAGVARTFQNLALCPGLTVEVNVMLGAIWRLGRSAISYWLGTRSAGAGQREARAVASEAMEMVGINHLAHCRVSELSHGMRRRAELARCLCARPSVMLLDEPASGLTEAESQELVRLLQSLRGTHDLSLIVIEHHLDVVMALADRVVVLDGGRTIAEGTPSEVVKNPQVVEAYLGTGAAHPC